MQLFIYTKKLNFYNLYEYFFYKIIFYIITSKARKADKQHRIKEAECHCVNILMKYTTNENDAEFTE